MHRRQPAEASFERLRRLADQLDHHRQVDVDAADAGDQPVVVPVLDERHRARDPGVRFLALLERLQDEPPAIPHGCHSQTNPSPVALSPASRLRLDQVE